MDIKDVLIVQKRELDSKTKELYIKRDIDASKMDSPLIKVITGPRRGGKSFFIIRYLNDTGAKFGYVNFDDERLVNVEDYDDIVNAINQVYENPKYLLLDEIQNLPNWELFVNRLTRQGYDLFVTGSNSNLLSKELATHLTGRCTLIPIFTFSFKEFLLAQQTELTASEKRARLSDYLLCGGYPEPLVKKMNYKDYVSTLFDAIIYKDIVKRYKIRFAQGIEDLAVYLLSNVAKEFSFNKLSQMVRVKSPHTIVKYLDYLEEAYLVFSLRRFSYKVKEQVASNRKIYGTDNGLVYAKAFQVFDDRGKLFENVVANELMTRGLREDFKIFYHKNVRQEEVDFVVRKGTEIIELIQVCYDLGNLDTKTREIRSLLKAGQDLKCDRLTIISDDYSAEEDAEWYGIKGKIKYIPLWKWLC